MTCQFLPGSAVTRAQPWKLIDGYPRSQGLSSLPYLARDKLGLCKGESDRAMFTLLCYIGRFIYLWGLVKRLRFPFDIQQV